MTIVSLAAAKGAPGTTTLALLASALWPRTSLLVDADVRGGDIASLLPLEAGGPVNPERGLMSLMPLARRSLEPENIPSHAQTLLGGTELIAGLSEPEQAEAVARLWPVVAGALAGVRTHDVIADLGTLRSSSPHLSIARESSALVFVMRPRPADVIHTRNRLLRLGSELAGRGPQIGVVVVAEQGRGREAESAYASLGPDVHRTTTYLGHLPLDRSGVEMFEGRVINRPERTLLVRSGMPIIEQIAQLAQIRISPEEIAAAGQSVPTSRKSARRAEKRSGKGRERRAATKSERRSGDRSESASERHDGPGHDAEAPAPTGWHAQSEAPAPTGSPGFPAPPGAPPSAAPGGQQRDAGTHQPVSWHDQQAGPGFDRQAGPWHDQQGGPGFDQQAPTWHERTAPRPPAAPPAPRPTYPEEGRR